MKVKYTAIGANNRKLEGVLDAESLDAARDELHKMSLSVIAIEEIPEEEASKIESQTATPVPPAQPSQEVTATEETTPSQEIAPKPQESAKPAIISYYFTAKDPSGKDVNGTIDADDPESAFRRLVTEYQFSVTDLYPEGSTDPASASLKGEFEEWRKMLEDEGIDLEVHHAGTKSELEEEEEEMSEEIVNEIDQFIINTKKVISDHRNQYSDPFIKEIENTLGELERIRSSNNLRHITKICNNLYELIAHPDNIQAATEQTEAEAGQEYDSIISSLKNSGFISNKLAFLQAHSLKKKSAKFENIQKTFGKILGMLSKKKGEAFTQNLRKKRKKHHARWLTQLTDNLKGEKTDAVTFKIVFQKFFSWISAPNAILRKARKQELIRTYHEWQSYRKKIKSEKSVKTQKIEKATKEGEGISSKIAEFFMEIDSFIAWLLFFYIVYFFLATFSLEKDIGLPQELILKTFDSNLLINIAIFLVIAHLAFLIKFRLFRGHILSSVFLFFLSFGIYAILMANF
jgi:sugar-specific transcriptional regulator TrmB